MEIESILDPEVVKTSRDMNGWLRLVGITSIVGGALSALSIIGIIVAWLPIWQGVLLIRSANGSREVGSGDPNAINRIIKPLKTYFIIQGIIILISIFAWVIMLFTIGFSGLSNILGGSGFY